MAPLDFILLGGLMKSSSSNVTKSINSSRSHYIHCLIGFALMFIFWVIPPINCITPLGMRVVGILLCTLYLWTTVDTIWPSFVGILFLGISGFAPMNSVITTTFGNPLAILLMYVIILTGAISEEGICEYVSRWFVTRKIINGRPWMFSLMLLLGVYLLATLTMATATIFMFWPILYSLFQVLDLKKEDKYTTLMLISVVMVATLSFASTPFKSILPGLLNSFKEVTGSNIEYLPYMFVGTCISLVSILGIILLMKYVFKPDVSKLKNIHTDMFNQNPLPPMNTRQKVLIGLVGIFILWMLVPSLLPEGPIRTFLNSTQNASPILCIALGGFLKIDGRPLIPFAKITSKYMSWPVFLMVASSNSILNALTSEQTGVTPFLQSALMPIFEGKSVLAFTVLIMVICIIITNLCNNIVVGMLFIPIINIFASQNSISPIPMGIIMLFVVCLALVTPASSALGAALHSNQEWLQVKDIYKYTIIMSLLTLIVAFVVGLPLLNLIF